jgi:hypothetical protein
MPEEGDWGEEDEKAFWEMVAEEPPDDRTPAQIEAEYKRLAASCDESRQRRLAREAETRKGKKPAAPTDRPALTPAERAKAAKVILDRKTKTK